MHGPSQAIYKIRTVLGSEIKLTTRSELCLDQKSRYPQDQNCTWIRSKLPTRSELCLDLKSSYPQDQNCAWIRSQVTHKIRTVLGSEVKLPTRSELSSDLKWSYPQDQNSAWIRSEATHKIRTLLGSEVSIIWFLHINTYQCISWSMFIHWVLKINWLNSTKKIYFKHFKITVSGGWSNP